MRAEGVEITPFYEYPDWVNIVALDQNDYLRLIRQYGHGLEHISLELPCGGLNGVKPCLKRLAASFLRESMTLAASVFPNAATHSNFDHAVPAELVSVIGKPVQDAQKFRCWCAFLTVKP